MEIEALLKPISEDCPCGADLEYDSDFTLLVSASQGKPERRIGETVVPAEEPDWADIRQRAEIFFSRTKDLRVAILLARALIHCEGMVGLASGLKLIKSLLTLYWDSIYPLLDQDDDNDPTMRLNVLASLVDVNGVVRDIRGVKFIATNHARISMRDILITLGKLPAHGGGDGVTLSQIEIESIIRSGENSLAVQAMRDVLQTLNGIQTALSEKVGVERTLELKILSDMFKPIVTLCDIPAAAGESHSDGIAMSSSPSSPDGEIRSREDVVRMLEKICKFIERTEPTNPASLLIRRAQSLMTKNFVEIIKDLAPGGLEQILRIMGSDSEKK